MTALPFNIFETHHSFNFIHMYANPHIPNFYLIWKIYL